MKELSDLNTPSEYEVDQKFKILYKKIHKLAKNGETHIDIVVSEDRSIADSIKNKFEELGYGCRIDIVCSRGCNCTMCTRYGSSAENNERINDYYGKNVEYSLIVSWG